MQQICPAVSDWEQPSYFEDADDSTNAQHLIADTAHPGKLYVFGLKHLALRLLMPSLTGRDPPAQIANRNPMTRLGYEAGDESVQGPPAIASRSSQLFDLF